MPDQKITAADILQRKGTQPRLAALTAYDHPTALLLDRAGVPLILVGDSLGMVVLGYPDTTHVTMADMEHHVRAVARAHLKALLVADLPYRSYETPGQAVENSRRLVAAGAEAVKAEGGLAILPQIRAIVAAGIPFLGHLGMLPQHVREEGGYHIKGRVEAEHAALLADADALVTAGVFAMVLELVTPPVARELTQRVPVPTIGIGSGAECDGQVLVITDLLGLSPDYIPKHVKFRGHLAAEIDSLVRTWMGSL